MGLETEGVIEVERERQRGTERDIGGEGRREMADTDN